jgi:hypothetical protein
MSKTFTTPLMNLNLPITGPGGEPGPQYADDNNTAFERVDSHNHTAGNGAQIPVAGLNINADVVFNGNSAMALKSSDYQNQGATFPTVKKYAVYAVNGDLYWNNGSGTPVQVTSGSGINAGSIGGIGGDYATSGASLAFTSAVNTFIFTKSGGLPAKIQTSDHIITSPDGTKTTTLHKNNAGTTNDVYLIDSLPAAEMPMKIDNLGQMTASQVQTAQIADSAVTVLKLAANSVSVPKLGTDVYLKLNSQTFTSSGTFTVPAGVSILFVFAYGGGGGGGGSYFDGSTLTADGGGGGGAIGRLKILSVTPSSDISVVIGTGGGGAGVNSPGGSGGTTSVGSLNFNGAQGGKRGSDGIIYLGGSPPVATSVLFVNAQGNAYSGGATQPSDNFGAGANMNGGGGGEGGAGGNGGSGLGTNGASAAANTGGGGGGGGANVPEKSGGNGGSGKAIIYWYTF